MLSIPAACVLGLAACGFQIPGGAARDGGPIDDGEVVDMPPDGPRAPWWDPSWMHRRSITIDGAKLLGDVQDFPVLVKIPPLGAANVQDDGDDVRFIASDGTTVLAYELDTFTLGDTSYAWVALSLASQVDTTLWLYYGNASAPSLSSGAGVFGHYVSVHHLGDSLADASGHNHGASSPNANQTPAAIDGGAIGRARTFDSNDDYLRLGGSESDYDVITTLSVTVWIRLPAYDEGWQALVTKGDNAWRLHRSGGGDGVALSTNSGDTGHDMFGTDVVTSNRWRHVAGVLDGTTKWLYIDGIVDEHAPYALQIDNNSRVVRIGANEDSATPRYWAGEIDELRFSREARSAAWIAAEHTTVTDETFVMVGAAEPL